SPSRVSSRARVYMYRLEQVACSYRHSIVVTDDNRTWTFGDNDFGQLGHGFKERRAFPTPVDCFEGVGVLSVACGMYHTVREPSHGRGCIFLINYF
ncbi:unnamed protein product, partial [Laminaria digitata]